MSEQPSLAATSIVADVVTPGSVEGIAADALLLATAAKGIEMASQAAHRIAEARRIGRSLGVNPFKNKTFNQIDRHLRQRGFDTVGKAPEEGVGSYFHSRSGRKYYLDKGKVYSEGLEKPHVDVHRKNIVTGKNVEEVPELSADSTLTAAKRKYPLDDQLLDSTIKPPTQTPKF